MSTVAQITANRTNSKLSTGPATETGKANSKLNGLKSGLTGRTVVMPSDDLAAYQAHLETFERKFAPVTDEERALVQSLADTDWRLARIPSLEAGIYALGHLEFSGLFEDQGDDTRKALIDAKIFITYQRQLNNLSIQENRLRRQRDKDTEVLKAVQHERKNAGHKRISSAALELINCIKEKITFDHAAFGFGFSMEKIERRAASINPRLFPHVNLTFAERSNKYDFTADRPNSGIAANSSR